MSAQTNTLWPISQLSESHSALHRHSHLDCDEDKQYCQPQSFQSSWKRPISNLINNNMRTQHTHLLHIECRAQYYFAVLKQTTSSERYHQVRMLSSQWELSPDPDVYLFLEYVNLLRVECWASLHIGTRFTSTCLQSKHLQAAEIYTHTTAFWISLPHIFPQFGDWLCHLDTCHRFDSSDHRTWWRSRRQVLVNR